MTQFLTRLMAILALFTLITGALSVSPTYASATLKSDLPVVNYPDDRSLALATYLESHRSPLARYADVFVQVADKYQLDWKLLPAIAGTESTFAKHYVLGTYNAYGWGGGYIPLVSWENSIGTISASLRQKYLDKGAITPEQIGRIWAPPSRTWASHVHYFMNQIDAEYRTQRFLTLSL